MDLGPSKVAGVSAPAGPPVVLSADQTRALRGLVADHPHGVILRDERDGYVGVYLIDPDGNVVKERLLFPIDFGQ